MRSGKSTNPASSRAKTGQPTSINPEDPARNFYKARLTKGLLAVGVGEGPIVEIINYRTRKILRRELFEDQEEARGELLRVREDIQRMTIDQFRSKYLQVR